jgi:hypothetical protein
MFWKERKQISNYYVTQRGEKGNENEYMMHCVDISIVEDIIDHVQNADDFDSTIVKKHNGTLVELVENEEYKLAQDLFIRY